MTYAFQGRGPGQAFREDHRPGRVDLAARPGTVLGVPGPNGAGKTTAIRILATLLRPDGGRAAVGGLDVVPHASEVRRLIGLTGQYASVDQDLTGQENLPLIGQLLDLRGSQAKARAAELLDRSDTARSSKLAPAGRSPRVSAPRLPAAQPPAPPARTCGPARPSSIRSW